MNQNNDFDKVLEQILLACDDDYTRYKIMIFLINKTLNLTLVARKTFMGNLIKQPYFKQLFKMFNVHMNKNSKLEQGFGPFSSLFISNKWTSPDEMNDFIDSLTQKNMSSEYQKSLILYVLNVSSLNSAYSEGNGEKIQNECSNDDFNTFLLKILSNLQGKVYTENDALYKRTIGIAFNTHYVSKVRIKKTLQKELDCRIDPNVQSMIKNSINKLDRLMNDIRLDLFLSVHVDELIDNLKSVYEIDNICEFLCLKYYMYSANKNNMQCIEKIVQTISKNIDNLDKTSIEKMLSMIHHTDTLESFSNDTLKNISETIMYVIMNNKNSKNSENNEFKFDIVTSLKVFFDIFVRLSTIGSAVYTVSLESLKCNNEASILLALKPFLKIAHRAQMKEQDNAGKVMILNECLSYLSKYKADDIKNEIINILRECELNKQEITFTKLKLINYDRSLRNVVESRLSYKEKTKNLIYDGVFKDKKIKKPVFVSKKHMKNQNEDLVIDLDTLNSSEFISLLNCDVDIVKRYNEHPNIINKKLDFMSFLNVHIDDTCNIYDENDVNSTNDTSSLDEDSS
jgi:gas vesicle protein